jgi:hypothetical protein
MARYICNDLRLFGDEKFRALSPLAPSGQGLFLFLLNNPRNSGIPGLYSAGKAALAEELGWGLTDFEQCFQELSHAGMAKADWKNRIVWLPNCLRYNAPNASSIVIHWGKVADELIDCELVRQGIQGLYECCQSKDVTYQKAFTKAFPRFKATATQSATPTARPTATPTATNAEVLDPSPVPPGLSPPVHIHLQPHLQSQVVSDDGEKMPEQTEAAGLAYKFHFLWKLPEKRGKKPYSPAEIEPQFAEYLRRNPDAFNSVEAEIEREDRNRNEWPDKLLARLEATRNGKGISIAPRLPTIDQIRQQEEAEAAKLGPVVSPEKAKALREARRASQ